MSAVRIVIDVPVEEIETIARELLGVYTSTSPEDVTLPGNFSTLVEDEGFKERLAKDILQAWTQLNADSREYVNAAGPEDAFGELFAGIIDPPEEFD